VICPGCGRENPEGFQFCGFCATPLVEAPPTPPLEERKVVSVLFCDLVGFTAASERADPEDVSARLRPYHARVAQEIERHGGTVEKFVGDAVMAVFGAPLAHEDDPERAVRTGLGILEAIEVLNAADPGLALHVRIGINTGEAAVNRAARPERGEGIVAGDVVNTAARLQSAAPVDQVVVSETTFDRTNRVFDYQPLESVHVKGKTEALAIWRPVTARSRLAGERSQTHPGVFVGRDVELARVRETLDRALRNQSTEVVTIIGEPGIGKTRFLAEFRAYVDGLRSRIAWRQGRCLPYGDGIAFWALGEIVKAHAGIYDSDTVQVAEEKLEAVLPEVEERPWLRARMLPLLGIDSGQPASREELFTAWSRFLETIAFDGAVIVVEDLHWADLALLDFLTHLGVGSARVPQLLLCTARPELYDRRPAWGERNGNFQAITLSPLPAEEMVELVSALATQALSEDMERIVLDRADGNPLYAEEIVRVLATRDLLAGPLPDFPVPDSLQSLIAARLDTLSADRKSLLQDAAVIGNVFWPTARDLHDVELALDELARKELILASAESSMEAESEYAFWHMLIRDVAYAEISRAERIRRHSAAAQWIEARAGERLADLAEVISHHYLVALDLSRVVEPEKSEELRAEAIRYLALAGERALGLDVDRAEATLAKALELAPAGYPQRAHLLEHWAQAALQQSRLQEARAALEEALALHQKLDENVAAGRVLTAITVVLQRLGDPRHQDAIVEALGLLESEPPGPELIAALAQLAGTRIVGTAYAEAVAAAERALALAAELGLPESARALGFRGHAASFLGERQGMEDMRRALELALDQGQGRNAAVLYNNLSLVTWLYEGPRAAHAVNREGIEFSERRGITEWALAMAAGRPPLLAELGQTEQALAEAGPLAKRLQAVGDIFFVDARSLELRLLAERGTQLHVPAAEELVATAREASEPQYCCTLAFAPAAQLLAAQGRRQEAKALLVELGQVPGIRADPNYASLLPELVRTARVLGEPELAAELVDGVEPHVPVVEHALCTCRAQLAEAAGGRAEAADLYDDAAERWREFGNVPERAYALLGQGRCLVSLGPREAVEPLGEARELFASMGYKPTLTETETLLEHAVRRQWRDQLRARPDPGATRRS
jgi:class 3 adenylate cyclase/tetratricopeptide (TPR) repeat protein